LAQSSHAVTVPPREAVDHLLATFDNAKAVVGHVDGVVLPELALRKEDHERLKQAITTERRAFLVSGISEAASGSDRGANYFTLEIASAAAEVTVGPQYKHHRWRLDKGQILQYGLGGVLDPTRFWWEDIRVHDRTLAFVSLNPWLTICILICEDLARQDPVAELVRAVGPNLVIALLLDGPQLKARWSARYATVLADDPGSSVLTVTSLGMVQLCRPLGLNTMSRVIGLWKDAKTGGPFELDLPRDADGMVLSLAVDWAEEWTADGRSDDGSTAYPILAGVYPVAAPPRS
jgi:hypothetical protein